MTTGTDLIPDLDEDWGEAEQSSEAMALEVLEAPETESAELNDLRAHFPSTQGLEPHERAQVRLARLRGTFSMALATLAEMHHDEDWKYLTREDGSAYRSLTELVSDLIPVCGSMARRYVQAATQFYLPLSELVVEGTVIEITSADVATLGNAGLQQAVGFAAGRLDGVEDPDAAQEIINGAVADAKAARTTSKRASESDGWGDEGGWAEGDGWAEGFDPGSSSPSGRTFVEGGPGAYEDLVDDLPPGAPVSAGASGFGVGTAEDPSLGVLAGATDYADPGNLAELPEPLRAFVEAIQTIGKADGNELANLVTFETRGVLLGVEEAQRKLVDFRVGVETKDWFLDRYGI